MSGARFTPEDLTRLGYVETSPGVAEQRAPLPPEILIDALQDTVHRDVGRGRAANDHGGPWSVLRLPWTPALNRRHTVTAAGRITTATGGKRYRRACMDAAFATGPRQKFPRPARVEVDLTLHPPTHDARGRKRPADKDGDIDARNKAILDALEGIAYDNDRQARPLHVYDGEPVAGGCVVARWRLSRVALRRLA